MTTIGWLAAAILLNGSGATGCQQLTRAGIPVLTYHRFDPKDPGSTTVTTETLCVQLKFLEDHGYTFLPLQSIVAAMQGRTPFPDFDAVAITVDDGHRSVYTILYPIISKRHIPVTLFIYPSVISHSSWALTWDQLREMKASGLVDIQSHTYWHPDFHREKARRSSTDYTSFVDMQLARSKRDLDKQLGTHVDLLAWPYGIVDRDLEMAARRAGYVAAFGFDGKLTTKSDDIFAIQRIPVPNSARGAAFDALLHARRHSAAHPEQGHGHEQ